MTDLKKICAAKLKDLSKNITVEDRTEAESYVPMSRPTLDKYMLGDIANIDKATRLIKFLTDKVNERFEKLRETTITV